MNSISRVLVGIAATAVFFVIGSTARAQCAVAYVFQSMGNAMASTCAGGPCKQVTVDTTGVDNSGKEIGRFWAAANSTQANNFGGTCPSTNPASPIDGWWKLAGTDRGVDGGITVGLCTASTCPDATADTGDQMVFLIEDYAAGGPPGIGKTAYWVAFRVDATPAAPRIWDLARVSGGPPVNTTLPFREFPIPVVTASARNLTGGVDVATNYVDIGLNLHSATGANNAALPDNSTIKAYDICTFHGQAEPGRLRTGWNCVSSIPYSNSAVTGAVFKVACSDPVGDTWMAVGVTFKGGAGPDVKSALVGRAIKFECNPNIADPQPLHPGLRPVPKKTSKPGRSGRP